MLIYNIPWSYTELHKGEKYHHSHFTVQTCKFFYFFLKKKRSSGSPELNCARTPSFQIDWGHAALMCTLSLHSSNSHSALHFSPIWCFLLVSHSEIFNRYHDHIGLQNWTAFSDGAVNKAQVNLPDSVRPRISVPYKRQGFMFIAV